MTSGCPGETDGPTSSGSTSSGDDGPSCQLAYLGDPNAEMEIELFFYGADEADHDLVTGGPIDIIEPPQGGRVLFVGVRATNVDPCGAQLEGRIRDKTTSFVRLDSRTINLAADGTGWGRSVLGDIASYANIPVCHNTWSDLDIYGETFQLEVDLRDRTGKLVQRTMDVVPVCAEMEPDKLLQCECICAGDYVLGDPCGAGGGGGA